jgi:hypothetical protein
MDLHISVIADFKAACPDVEVVEWCMSGHAWVFQKNQERPKHINPDTWASLDDGMINAFQTEYDEFLKSFDGFIVAHVNGFAQIYEKYGKPVLMINSCRYDLPFCFSKNLEMLEAHNSCLKRMADRGQLFAVSNNKADQLYTLRGSGVQTQHIPSLGLYAGIKYTGTRPTFLLFNGNAEHPLLSQRTELGQPYKWSDIGAFRGIVHFPNEISTMTMFEHFSGGMPMFFPSMTYFKSAHAIQSVSAYWGDELPEALGDLNEPNVWIELSDMYDTFKVSPNTRYFDSIEHLGTLLETFEYTDDTAARLEYIASVKARWSDVISRMISGKFYSAPNRHLCYNRLPLLANVVYDGDYTGSGVVAQHSYPYDDPMTTGDVVFVKTDLLGWWLSNRKVTTPITLVTGVSDPSPTFAETSRILDNPNIVRWIGTNILASHRKIRKMPIGVGEPERHNGKHELLLELHTGRMSWESKVDTICVPYHSSTHASRNVAPTLEALSFPDYMEAINKHKFVLCVRGKGVDTHRFCEALLMGCVPIVGTSGLDDMYSRFPCLIVKSVADPVDTKDFMWDESKYEAFLDTFWLREGLQNYLFR